MSILGDDLRGVFAGGKCALLDGCGIDWEREVAMGSVN